MCSYTRAQAADPSLSRPWVGQALIAETIASAEALDLYRHAYELHAHPQALFGFGYASASDVLSVQWCGALCIRCSELYLSIFVWCATSKFTYTDIWSVWS